MSAGVGDAGPASARAHRPSGPLAPFPVDCFRPVADRHAFATVAPLAIGYKYYYRDVHK